jgi:hypothetical protein
MANSSQALSHESSWPLTLKLRQKIENIITFLKLTLIQIIENKCNIYEKRLSCSKKREFRAC